MEKEKVNLRKSALGIETWVVGPSEWCVRIGLYWFGAMFCMKWQRPNRYGSRMSERWTGVTLAWKLNPNPVEGAFIWLNIKEWGRYAT